MTSFYINTVCKKQKRDKQLFNEQNKHETIKRCKYLTECVKMFGNNMHICLCGTYLHRFI
jgi:hypothetical protein